MTENEADTPYGTTHPPLVRLWHRKFLVAMRRHRRTLRGVARFHMVPGLEWEVRRKRPPYFVQHPHAAPRDEVDRVRVAFGHSRLLADDPPGDYPHAAVRVFDAGRREVANYYARGRHLDGLVDDFPALWHALAARPPQAVVDFQWRPVTIPALPRTVFGESRFLHYTPPPPDAEPPRIGSWLAGGWAYRPRGAASHGTG